MAAKNAFIGAGAVDVAVKNKQTGLWGGWFPIANCEKFEYTAQSNTETVQSFSENTFGQAFDSEEIPQPGELAFTVSELNAKILAMTMAASLANSTVTGASVTGEEFTVSTGDSILLANFYVSNLEIWQKDIACTLTIATDLVTANAHGLRAGQKIVFSDVTTTTGITTATDYYVRDVTTNTFKVAATVGGAAIDLATNNGTGIFDALLQNGFDFEVLTSATNNNHFEITKSGLTDVLLSVDYDYADSTWVDMDIGGSNYTIRVRFSGVNRRTSKRVYGLWADVTVNSGTALGLISAAFQPFEVKGTVNIDKDPDSATYGKIGVFKMET